MRTFDIPALVVSPDTMNITDLLVDRAKKTPDLALYALAKQGGYETVSAAKFLAEVQQVAKGLIASGIQPSQAVGLMSRTRYEWTIMDFAIWFAGAVSVPIYETSSAAQMEWILSNSDSVALIAENKDHTDRFGQVKAAVPLVRLVLTFEDNCIEELKKRGKEITDEVLEQRRQSSKLHDLATIIYTSGTTGKPKGCEPYPPRFHRTEQERLPRFV